MSFCVKKMDGLPYSPYIEYSCQVLHEAAEHEIDLILVACVRLQAIVESINRNITAKSSITDIPKAPHWMHATSIRSEFQTILVSLPPNLQNNGQYNNPISWWF